MWSVHSCVEWRYHLQVSFSSHANVKIDPHGDYKRYITNAMPRHMNFPVHVKIKICYFAVFPVNLVRLLHCFSSQFLLSCSYAWPWPSSPYTTCHPFQRPTQVVAGHQLSWPNLMAPKRANVVNEPLPYWLHKFRVSTINRLPHNAQVDFHIAIQPGTFPLDELLPQQTLLLQSK
jgi:hypothetical protein